jgi:hypothetical protein
MLRAAADSAERWKPRLSSCQETYFQITKDKETGQLVAQG